MRASPLFHIIVQRYLITSEQLFSTKQQLGNHTLHIAWPFSEKIGSVCACLFCISVSFVLTIDYGSLGFVFLIYVLVLVTFRNGGERMGKNAGAANGEVKFNKRMAGKHKVKQAGVRIPENLIKGRSKVRVNENTKQGRSREIRST